MRKAHQEPTSPEAATSVDGVSKAPRKDGRRALLVYLDPSLIRDLKKAALDRDINLYELVEELLKSQTKSI
jgi:hypothetical protein